MTIKKFFMFLAEHKALGAYFAAFEKDCEQLGTDESKALNSLFLNSPQNWIISAFYWDNTMQGSDYWVRLNSLWNDSF